MSPEYEALLALKDYLDKDNAEKLKKMVQDKVPLDEINRFVNNEITKRQICTARLLDAETAMMEYKEYEHKLNEEEKLYVQKFYYEMYGNAIYNVPEDYRLLNTKEMIKESNRNRNNYKSEMYDIGTKQGILNVFNDEAKAFLDGDENQYNWETVFTYFGHEAALNFLIDQATEELKMKHLDKRLTLVRFYIKMNRLRLAQNKEARNSGRR